MYPFLSRGWCVIFYIFLTSIAYGQKATATDSYLLVESNFDSVYVIIDDAKNEAQKTDGNDLIQLETGQHSITVIPEYAPTYTFNGNFLADSFYVAKLQFGYILDEQNPAYKEFETNNSAVLKESQYHSDSFRNSSFGIATYSKSGFYNRNKLPEIDYENTYLKIISNTDSVYVRPSAGSPKTIRIANGDSIRTLPRNTRIILSHQNGREINFRRTLKSSSTTKISYRFNLQKPSLKTLTDNIATKAYYNANLLVVSDDDSRIFINGELKGKGAVRAWQKTGPVKVTILNPKTGRHNYTTQVKNLPGDRAVVVDAYTKPVRSTAHFLGLLPGASQLYKKQKFKAAVVSGGFFAFTGLAINSNLNYSEELKNFNRIEGDYNAAETEFEALKLGNLLEEKHALLQKKNQERKIFLGLASLFYAFNIYDTIFSKPKSGYRTQTDVNFYLKSDTISGNDYSSLSLNYAF